jgi:hypothetical protein
VKGLFAGSAVGSEAVAPTTPDFAEESVLSATVSELVSRRGESLMRRQAASPSSVAVTA